MVKCAGFILILAAASAFAQSDRDFSGSWKLNDSRSRIRDTPALPLPWLKITQNAAEMTVSGSSQENGNSVSLSYPLNGNSKRTRLGDTTYNSVSKWEGTALLVNTIVSGRSDYSVQERWEISRDRTRLTLTRTLVQQSGESESVLVFENTELASPPPSEPRQFSMRENPPRESRVTGAAPGPESNAPAERSYAVAAGSRLLVRLTNAVNTKHTAAGDHVYLQTAAPVFVSGRLVIPVGSYVIGTVTESQRAGRVKGTSALALRFESVTLPNGITRDVRSRAGSVDTAGNLDRTEGKIKGESNKAGDLGKVAQTTAIGTGVGAAIGSAAGHIGTGAGIGAAAGALGGLAGVLGSRGQDVVLPSGTTLEIVLDRDLTFSDSDLR
jgi:type IV secretion system protein VirB10